MGKGLERKKLEELLRVLKETVFLAPYSLAMCRQQGWREAAKFHTPTAFVVQEKKEPEQSDPRLAAVVEAIEDLDQMRTVAQTVRLCSKTIMEQFQVERLAVALREEGGKRYLVTGAHGAAEEFGAIPAEAVNIFLPRTKGKKMVAYDQRMRSVLPALQAVRCCCFPLQSQDQLLGFFLILDADLPKSDLMLVSMVAQAAAAKLSRLVMDAEQARESARSDRLMALANTLLMVDNKQELYECILSIACDLVEAMQGSIMLLDSLSETMAIAYRRGSSLDPSHAGTVKVGKGIAGLVAQTGQPLLVPDLEKDGRFHGTNRPRFNSKSLISIPLKLKEKVIGVLNLSEKKNLAPFTSADLQLLTSFANLACVMIERTTVLEKSMQFEQLSVTDSLTGLYNRRFLKSRLEEELNRSMHQGLNLTLLFIDLDFFKTYNDVCGHIAGDRALKRIADIIKGSVREMDVVARYGGEEFCAVLPGTPKAEALLVAERIRCEIEAEYFRGASHTFSRRITASIGVASFPEDGCSFTALVHAADMALYQAKAGGRNKVVAAHRSALNIRPTLPPKSVPAAEPALLVKAADHGA